MKIYWFDGVGKLLLEGIVDICIFLPFVEIFCMLADNLTEVCTCTRNRDDWLRAGIISRDGEWLAGSNDVVHCGWHDRAKVSVGCPSHRLNGTDAAFFPTCFAGN